MHDLCASDLCVPITEILSRTKLAAAKASADIARPHFRHFITVELYTGELA